MKKRIALLGSTGSIGVQTLEVVSCFPEHFEVEVLTAHSNTELLIQQAKQFQPNCVVIADETQYRRVKEALWSEDIKVYAGANALCDVVEMSTVDVVVAAIVGVAGLAPVYRAICAGKPIALANKETLVVAGELMTKAAAEKNVPLLPVDSEHSAIFQSLVGEQFNAIEKLIITASGGPFRGKKYNDLLSVTPEDALKHPNWNMGRKISIDSATLLNKGLEVIEAKWLFNVPLEKIEVVVHPQSIIHSLVQFEDGSLKAQLGLPDMKLPIQYALTFPFRMPSDFPRFNFSDFPFFSFEKPDYETFTCLQLALNSAKVGADRPCVMNAANEVAVQKFLQRQISFLEIPKQIEFALGKVPLTTPNSVEEYLAVDYETRQLLQSC
mgnify:FL=1